jgi:hypothetical protein
MHRWPGKPQASLDLRADRKPLEDRSQLVDDNAIEFVTAVVANRVTEQAGGHAKTKFLGLGSTCCG